MINMGERRTYPLRSNASAYVAKVYLARNISLVLLSFNYVSIFFVNLFLNKIFQNEIRQILLSKSNRRCLNNETSKGEYRLKMNNKTKIFE